MDSFILNSQLDELTHLMDKAREVQDVMANHAKDIPEVKLLMTIPGIDFTPP
jgi:transposase